MHVKQDRALLRVGMHGLSTVGVFALMSLMVVRAHQSKFSKLDWLAIEEEISVEGT